MLAHFTRLGIVKSLSKSHISSSFFAIKSCLDLFGFFLMLIDNVSHRGMKGFRPNQSTVVHTTLTLRNLQVVRKSLILHQRFCF